MNQYRRSRMESIGVYLPPKTVTTAEIVKGCSRRVLVPLQRLTGIESVQVAGEDEFGFDLAVKAIDDCLAVSTYTPDDIDLVISCNISHFDAADEYSIEPSRAARLRAKFGMNDALAFDITNACAGMFTGIYMADALIRSGAVQRALIVSGEYITHLTKTAQKEIKGLADLRLACLTLGDAGAAVIIDGATDAEAGFHALELFTMGQYSPLCIAKTTDQPHGGAIMTTDMIGLAKIAVTAFLKHSAYVMFRLGWQADSVDHVIPHQTSRTTLDGASKETQKAIVSRGFEFKDKLINNVAKRGNTATTSHFVALKDCFQDGRIKSGEGVVFGILASGITIGTSAYRFDDLPERVRNRDHAAARPDPVPAPRSGAFAAPDKRPRIRIESTGTLAPDRTGRADTLVMLTEASEDCIDRSRYDRSDIDLLLSTGVYRTDFLSEPAIASLLAGLLRINDDPKSPVERLTLAFDLLHGGLGFLTACYVASELIRSRALKRAMIATSEIENNAAIVPDHLRGIRQTASAAILDASEDGATGFGAFRFQFFPEHADALRVYGSAGALQIDDRFVARLFAESAPDLEERFIDCILATVEPFLQAEGLTFEDVSVILPPQISPDIITRISERSGANRSKFVDISLGGEDLFTSSIPCGFAHIYGQAKPDAGQIGLVIGVAAGLEVGCALYHF